MNVLDVVILTAFLGLGVVAGRSLMRTRNLTRIEDFHATAPILGSSDLPSTSGDCADCSGGGDCG